MVSEATITDGNAFPSRSAASSALAEYCSLLYSRKLASLLIAFAFVLSFSLPTEAATITVSATCTLPDAIISANTDTAVGGCPAGSGRDTIRLSGTINLDADLPTITAPVDIRGPSDGYATVDGQDMYKIFEIDDGVNPNIRNLILQNGRGHIAGAIYIAGGGTISNMQFRNNTADSSYTNGAGAIVHDVGSGTLSLSDSSFTSNVCVCDFREHSRGAGALTSRGNLDGRNLTFRNNESDWHGGAVSILTGSNVILTNSYFEDNSAGSSYGGGALYVSPLGNVTVNYATFRNNYAGIGGAIYVWTGLSTTVQLTVNSATFDGNRSVYHGSAITSHGSISNLSNVRFRNNTGGEAVVYRSSAAGSVTINCLLELRNNEPNVISPGVTINKCPGDGGSEPEPVVVSPEVTIAHNQAVIDEHGYAVTVPHGLGTIAFKALNPKDCGTIGNQAVCDMDVLQVADVSGWAEQGIRFCFKGYGQVLFVPSHDADRQPINQKTAQPETLPVEVDGEHVCVTINRDGKLFLIDAAPLVTRTQAVSPVPYSPTGSGPAPETDCDLPPRLQVGDRAFRDGYDPSNLRSDAARTGQDIGDISRGVVVTVIEGPVNRDNYNWYKVTRDGGGSGWVAESGDTDNGCGYFFGKVAAEEAAQEVD